MKRLCALPSTPLVLARRWLATIALVVAPACALPVQTPTVPAAAAVRATTSVGVTTVPQPGQPTQAPAAPATSTIPQAPTAIPPAAAPTARPPPTLAVPTATPSPEYLLAIIERGASVRPTDPVVAEFGRALDRLSAKCPNDPRSRLADFAAGLQKAMADKAVKEDLPSILQHVTDAIPGAVSQFACADVFAAYGVLRTAGMR